MNDLTVRICTLHDMPEMARIWSEIFGDSSDFIDSYYRNANTLSIGLFSGENAAGMLNITDITYVYGTFSLHGGYIYAAGIDAAFRGSGYFTRLISYAETLGYDFLFLIPAGSHLYPMYRHLGYSTDAYADIYTASSAILNDTLPFDGCFDKLYDIYASSVIHKGGLLRSRGLFMTAIHDFSAAYTHDGGAFIYGKDKKDEKDENNENSIKIYEMFGSHVISNDIIITKDKRYGMIKNFTNSEISADDFGLYMDI